MTAKPAPDNQMSDTATELVKKTLFYADQYSFKEGMSDDMMTVLSAVANKVLDGIIIMYRDIFDNLSETQLAQFKNGFYESIGIGYKIYWAERKYIKNEDDFVKFKGNKFQTYLLKEYEAYFVDFTKDPEPLTPKYVSEAVDYFGTIMFKGAFVDGERIELTKRLAELNADGDFFDKVNILGLLKALIWTGYMLCLAQDDYRELAGVQPAHKPKKTRLIQ